MLASLSFLYSQDQVCDKRSICIITKEGFRGECEFANRMKIACARLGWEIDVCDLSSFQDSNYDCDWIFTMVPKKKCSLIHDDYLILFDPIHHFFNRKGGLNKEYKSYLGFLTTYDNIDQIVGDLQHTKKQLYPKRWYPTVQYRPYRKVIPSRLFYIIANWGNRLSDEKYKILQSKLALTDYTSLYGISKLKDIYGEAFKGEISYDGESLIDLISEHGVCLILHSDTHIKYEIPSGRIFEAVAASAVVISDLNPFVIKNFGDSVLYIDQNLDGSSMFEQIDAHIHWIKNHSKQALIMAKKAHKILENNFLLEDQLLDFNNFRESIKFKNEH